MKVFLHLEIGSWKESTYEKPLVTFASSLTSNLIGAEVDNQSDPAITDLLIRLIDQAESALVVVQAKPDQPLGPTLKLIHHLLKAEQKVYRVILSGKHEQAEKLLRSLGDRFLLVQDQDDIKMKIRNFASA